MSFTDLLTISMPCYERKDFFLEALESALNQTVKCEVIVVDNCSSHNYYEEVCRDKNVSYYRNERNIGMAANFSKGYELSDTTYVMNLQDDDRLHQEYVESFVNAVNHYPDLDIFFCDFEMITSHGILPHQHILPFGYMENGMKVIEYGITYKMGFPYLSSAIKRTKAHNYNDAADWIGSYDWEWIYSNADKFSLYGDQKKLYWYRIHDNQDTHVNSSDYTLTLPYIYDIILKEKVSDINLKRKASKNSFMELFILKSTADENVLNTYINGNTKYSYYLQSKLEENTLLKIVYFMPKWIINLSYKIFRKIGIISN